MAETVLKVMERTEKPQKTRQDGFTPGIIYGAGIDTGVIIKFEMTQMEKLLKNHIKNAKLQVKIGDVSRYCLVKDLQKHPVTGKIIHVDFQAVSEDEIVRLKVHINYEGVAALEANKLILLTNVTELELEGRVIILPESLNINVSTKKAGDKIHIADLKLDSSIKVHLDENETLAIVAMHKEIVEEVVAETVSTVVPEKAE